MRILITGGPVHAKLDSSDLFMWGPDHACSPQWPVRIRVLFRRFGMAMNPEIRAYYRAWARAIRFWRRHGLA